MTSPALSSEIKDILFVCTGNLCRSAIAEALAKKNCPQNKSLFIHSAGTDAISGRKSPEDAIVAGKKIKADMSAHRASPLSAKMIHKTDALFIMEPYHEERILALVPEAKDKVFYLRSFSGNNDSSLTIDDPYNMPMRVYNKCFNLIERCVLNVLSEIKKAQEKS